MDWTLFYATTAGSAATLLGLLFIAIQLHIDMLSTDPQSRWRAIARSTFDHYTSLFFVSLLVLFPNLTRDYFALFVTIIAGSGILRLLWVWMPVWRRTFRDSREWTVEVLWLAASPVAVYLAMLYFAARMLSGDSPPSSQPNIAYCVLGLFTIVLRNSWKLTIEMASDKRAP